MRDALMRVRCKRLLGMSLAKKIASYLAAPRDYVTRRGYRRSNCYSFINRRRFMESVFSRLYEDNSWGDEESVSGPGSNFARTTKIRRELPELLKQHSLASLLDAPCGDFNWMKETDLGVERYIGVDVVPDLIARNQKLYGDQTRQFRVLDITTDDVPEVDAILCRDCFIHLSYRHINAALANFKRSNSKYFLTNTYLACRKNEDISTGGFRRLNLQMSPFNFPEPLVLISEKFAEEEMLYFRKCLGLWRLKDL
jgi:SAM-dependent methyltransferase